MNKLSTHRDKQNLIIHLQTSGNRKVNASQFALVGAVNMGLLLLFLFLDLAGIYYLLLGASMSYFLYKITDKIQESISLYNQEEVLILTTQSLSTYSRTKNSESHLTTYTFNTLAIDYRPMKVIQTEGEELGALYFFAELPKESPTDLELLHQSAFLLTAKQVKILENEIRWLFVDERYRDFNFQPLCRN